MKNYNIFFAFFISCALQATEITFSLTPLTESNAENKTADLLLQMDVLKDVLIKEINLLEEKEIIAAGKYKLTLKLDVKQQLADYDVKLSYIYLRLPENDEMKILKLKSLDKDARLAKEDDFYVLELDPVDGKQTLELSLSIALTKDTPSSDFHYGILAKTKDGLLAEYLYFASKEWHKIYSKDFLSREFKKNEYDHNRILISSSTYSFKSKVTDWNATKNDSLTRQRYDYSCGAASVSTILTYFYKQPVGEKEVLVEVMAIKGLTNKDPADLERDDYFLNFLDLQKYAESKGFSAKGLSMPMASLKKLKVPVIVYVKIRNNQHFSVFRGMDDHYVYLADSTFGRLKIRLAKFQQIFYTRKDLKYPGKLLAIIPKTAVAKASINKDFMNVSDDQDLVQEMIEDGIIRTSVR